MPLRSRMLESQSTARVSSEMAFARNQTVHGAILRQTCRRPEPLTVIAVSGRRMTAVEPARDVSSNRRRRIGSAVACAMVPVLCPDLVQPASGSDLRKRALSEIMEAAGIEPASAVAPNRASTSVVRASSHPTAGSRTTCRRASHPEVSRSGRLALPRRRARFLAPNSGSRAQPGSTSPDLASTRRRVRVRSCSHLLLCRLIYEANRRPRLATLPENRPRRNLIAPVCVLRV